MTEIASPRILLIIGGGIAAYKSCELIRLIRKGGGSVTCVLTEGGAHFVTPMTLAALSENPVHQTLWDLKNEVEMGHIQLSREADLVVVCPATANMLAKMAAGIADDLATTLLLATDKPVMAVPAMNVRMWQHEAVQRNVMSLRQAGVRVVDPDVGDMACGEFGPGRLPEPEAIWGEIAHWMGHSDGLSKASEGQTGESGGGGIGGLISSIIDRGRRSETSEHAEVDLADPLLANKGSAASAPPTDPDAIGRPVEHSGNTSGDAGANHFAELAANRPLDGLHVLITAGPTHEPIDPVRYIANRSSGKQGFAIAGAAAAAGARVTLIAGPVHLPTPAGVERVDAEDARSMAEAVRSALPADIAIMTAAVSDWRTRDFTDQKIKKRGSAPPALLLEENPDILATLAASPQRPRLVVGFAAETEDVVDNAVAKRTRKGADWIVANDVSGDVMGGADNRVHLVTAEGVDDWPEMAKESVAVALIERIAETMKVESDER